MANLGPQMATQKFWKNFGPSDPRIRLSEIRPFGNLAESGCFCGLEKSRNLSLRPKLIELSLGHFFVKKAKNFEILNFEWVWPTFGLSKTRPRSAGWASWAGQKSPKEGPKSKTAEKFPRLLFCGLFKNIKISRFGPTWWNSVLHLHRAGDLEIFGLAPFFQKLNFSEAWVVGSEPNFTDGKFGAPGGHRKILKKIWPLWPQEST